MNLASPPRPLQDLFAFLQANHRINARIQKEDVGNCLHARRTVASRAYLLLFRALMTQSRPRLSKTKLFFEALERAPRQPLRSLAAFRRFVGGPDLGQGLAECPGWGDKTAALFVRNLAVIRRHRSLRELFWDDLEDLAAQPVRLPVDAVILEVFAHLSRRLGTRERLDGFAAINAYLLGQGYSSAQMLVWDDLWFWGFITQRSSPGGGPRTHGWNEEKYWSILNAPKSDRARALAEARSAEFLELIGATRRRRPAAGLKRAA